MRLDRVLVQAGGGRLDCSVAKAQLFADQPVHERGKGREPLHAGVQSPLGAIELC